MFIPKMNLCAFVALCGLSGTGFAGHGIPPKQKLYKYSLKEALKGPKHPSLSVIGYTHIYGKIWTELEEKEKVMTAAEKACMLMNNPAKHVSLVFQMIDALSKKTVNLALLSDKTVSLALAVDLTDGTLQALYKDLGLALKEALDEEEGQLFKEECLNNCAKKHEGEVLGEQIITFCSGKLSSGLNLLYGETLQKHKFNLTGKI